MSEKMPIPSFEDVSRNPEKFMDENQIKESKERAEIKELYAPFSELISEETFRQLSESKKSFTEKFERANSDLEAVIDILTCKKGEEPWKYYKSENKKTERSQSEIHNWDASANTFQIGDKEVLLSLSDEYLSNLVSYAHDIGGQIAIYGIDDNKKLYERAEYIQFLEKYIALEAVIPFLNEKVQFEPKSQPYFNRGDAYLPAQNKAIKAMATRAIKYIIENRNLLGSNREQVLKSAVDAAVGLAGFDVLGYTNKRYDEGGISSFALVVARDTLKKLIAEDSEFQYINEKTSQLDYDHGTAFKDIDTMAGHPGFVPAACLLKNDPTYGP